MCLLLSEQHSRAVGSGSVALSVYVAYTAGAVDGLTLHRPPQHTGNDFFLCWAFSSPLQSHPHAKVRSFKSSETRERQAAGSKESVNVDNRVLR